MLRDTKKKKFRDTKVKIISEFSLFCIFEYEFEIKILYNSRVDKEVHLYFF
jgi:hypothetical protein